MYYFTQIKQLCQSVVDVYYILNININIQYKYVLNTVSKARTINHDRASDIDSMI